MNLSVVVTSYGFLSFDACILFRELDIRRLNILRRFSVGFVICNENAFRGGLKSVREHGYWLPPDTLTSIGSSSLLGAQIPFGEEGLRAISCVHGNVLSPKGFIPKELEKPGCSAFLRFSLLKSQRWLFQCLTSLGW